MDRLARSPRQVGSAIQAARQTLGISQAELAQRAGLRQPTVSIIERGHDGVQFGTICALLATLDLELVVRPRSKAAPFEPNGVA